MCCALQSVLRRQYIALFIISSLIISCKSDSVVISEDYLNIKITNSSGDDFSYGTAPDITYFAPYPFNVGVHSQDDRTEEVMLISRQMDRGAEVAVLPIAKLTIKGPTEPSQDIFVAIPVDDHLRIIPSEDFYDFTIEQFSLKQIVEYWYSNRYGLQGTVIKGWSPASLEDLK